MTTTSSGDLAQDGKIDVHSHFVPDVYRAAAVAAGHSHPDGMPALPRWSEAEMLETMDRLGIATAILSISSPGVHFGDDAAARTLARDVNQEGARLKAATPARFGFFASLPLPDIEGSLAEIAFAFDQLGADGVVIESNSHGLYPGDPELEPILAELDRRGAVLFIHPTSPNCNCCARSRLDQIPRPVIEFMFETTRAVTNLLLSGALDRYPHLRIIIPHAGAALPVLADRVVAAAKVLPGISDNGGSDVIAALGRLYYDLAGAPLPRLLPALREIADLTHILSGSDWPFTPIATAATVFEQIDAVPEVDGWSRHAVHRGNAEQLFPRLSPAQRAND